MEILGDRLTGGVLSDGLTEWGGGGTAEVLGDRLTGEMGEGSNVQLPKGRLL